MVMKVLITGSHGLVGSNIAPFLRNYFDVTAIDFEEWNITDPDAGDRVLLEEKPNWVINLAAMTNVDGCEDRQAEAARLNSEAPATVAAACKAHGVRLIHFSTDYVFDGTKDSPYREDDPPNPKSVYGATKLAGERNVLAILPSSIIFRSQWIYGKGGENFISKVVGFAREKGSASVVNDQRGAPTFAKDLGFPLKRLMEEGKSGIFHVANSGSCTWYEFAKEIFRSLGMDVPVTPITSENLDRKAPRPAYSVFDCSKLRDETGVVMRAWQEALKDYLATD